MIYEPVNKELLCETRYASNCKKIQIFANRTVGKLNQGYSCKWTVNAAFRNHTHFQIKITHMILSYTSNQVLHSCACECFHNSLSLRLQYTTVDENYCAKLELSWSQKVLWRLSPRIGCRKMINRDSERGVPDYLGIPRHHFYQALPGNYNHWQIPCRLSWLNESYTAEHVVSTHLLSR